MKTLCFIPLANQPAADSAAGDLHSLRQDTLHLAWLFWAMHLLAELACAGAALVFYLSLFESGPIYLGGFTLIAYLAQGVYQVGIKAPRLSPLMDRIIWWRLVIAILSWPFHQALVEFRTKVDEASAENPQMLFDRNWMYETLFWALAHWGSIWLMTFLLPMMVALYIDQAGLVS